MHALTSLHQTITATLNEHQDNLILLCATVCSAVWSDWHHRNIKAAYHWPFVKGIPPVTDGFPLQRASNAFRFHDVTMLRVALPYWPLLIKCTLFDLYTGLVRCMCLRTFIVNDKDLERLTYQYHHCLCPGDANGVRTRFCIGYFIFRLCRTIICFALIKLQKTLAFMKQSLQNLAPNCLTHFKVSFISSSLGPQVQTHCSWKLIILTKYVYVCSFYILETSLTW